MANEQDDIKKGADDAGQPKHNTWKDIVNEEMDKINTEFPLSGGETEEDFGTTGEKGEGDKPAADNKEAGTEEPKHHTWKEIIKEEFEKIDTEFPLSGGETEEDFEEADDTEEGE